ncbi:GPP34 family phosphoprotein [Streptomyces sp. NBC_01728]|uniref:GOLPH3/VPS74 family protein n=1 Tax=unclassified Streptomyces TaxID=2593676 RepID=UPI00225201EE|nr:MULTISPECIES: GPP34 family phosphoprotein [unclassified Streptomyces]MCX4460032.1 GPP34 family phosphoprotein [Streptomyces sp. NBC_01719]MCX4499391.1 GPP34 family phosphoprotein [Streptomyces sp. NBC_01728]
MIDDLACLMYLLAYDDVAEGLYDRSRTQLLVRAAALTDLALRGRLGEVGGTVTVSGTEPTGDLVLDGVLRDAAGAGHGWKHLMRRHRKRTLTEVEDRLGAAGLLTLKAPRTRFGTWRLTVTDRAVPAALRGRVSAALHGDGPVGEIPAADAALLALAVAGGVRSVVSRQDQKTFRARIDACTGCLGALAPGLEKAVRALPTTMIAAQGGMGGS